MGNTIVFVSNSTIPEELLDIYYDTTEIIFLYLSSLLLILIIGLNVLVGISVSIMRRRRDVQNMCFAFTQNLCLADTMVGLSIISVAVLSPPMKIEDMNGGLQFRCAARVFVVGTCCQTSICALGTIAADRYSTIRRPFDRDQNFLLTCKGAWMLNFMIWTVSFVTNLLPIAGWSLDPDIDDLCQDSFREKATCRVSCLNFIPRGFVILLCGVIFIPMLTLIVILYSKILLISRAHLNSISEFDPKSSTVTRAQTPSVLHQSLSQSTASLSGGRRYSISNYFSQSSRSGRHQSIIVKLNHRRRASKKALRTVGLLLGCFFLTWCPFVGFFLYESCADELDTSRNTTLDWLLLLGMSNSLMNPIIYGRTNKEFKRFLVGLYRQARRGDTNEMTRSRASSVSIVCGAQQRELMLRNYEEKCVCQSCLADANRSGFLHPHSDYNEKDTSMSCSALESARGSNGFFIPTRRASTISLNAVRGRFPWYKTNATTPSCSVLCKKKIIHPVRRKKRKNHRNSRGRASSREDRIDSISEFSSTSNNDLENNLCNSPSSALGGLVMSPPEIQTEIPAPAPEQTPTGNQAQNGRQAGEKTAISLKL